MCYVVLLSTSSEEDLVRYNSDRVQFSRDLPTEPQPHRLTTSWIPAM